MSNPYRKAAELFLEAANSVGLVPTAVDYGDGPSVSLNTNRAETIEHILSVTMPVVCFKDSSDKEYSGWALLIFGNGQRELIADHSGEDPRMDTLFDAFQAAIEQILP
jgi:hypothetical protein